MPLRTRISAATEPSAPTPNTGTVAFLSFSWHPVPAALDGNMAHFNGRFTGIQPVSTNKYYNIYSILTGDPGFDLITISDPLAEKLKEHVCALFNEFISE